MRESEGCGGGYNSGAGRVTAGRFGGPRKVRTPKGRTLGKSQAVKADGKVAQKGDRHRRMRFSPETPAVRVKRWGKSPPASW
jgi:hypothetical protein